MLAVRGKLDNRQAIIPIGLQRFAIDDREGQSFQSVPKMPIVSYRALLDTGAQRTCLTYRTVAQERLQRHGKRFIKNVHSENVHGLYMAQFGFWCSDDQQRDPQSLENSYFGLPDPVEVINIADNDRFDAIIGMDIISRFDTHFYRSGDFMLELR